MRKGQNFQINSLDYLEDSMTLYGTYSAQRIEEILDAINYLHRNLARCEKMLWL